jgi:SAM-dependent methyltransferase
MSSETHLSILNEVAAYYAAKLETFGSTPQGVDWNSSSSHEVRHQQFLRLLDGNADSSIIDLGCGFGDFLRFLRSSGHRGRFVGYDVAPTMIDQARKLYGESTDHLWRVGTEPTEVADFAIASGIFNVKGNVPDNTWQRYLYRTMDLLAAAGSSGFAFNVLSKSSDPDRRRSNLFYADPVEILAYCLSRYGRSVAILQDYGLYEFTILIRHSSTSEPVRLSRS